MEQRRAIDSFGASSLIFFAAILAFNQVVIKVTSGGISPVFQAGLRSVGGLAVLLIWMYLRNVPFAVPRKVVIWGIVSGLLFSFEFVCLFIALDLTTVSRVSIIFYSMPVWLALVAHFVLPGERLNGVRALGLALALGGVALAMTDRSNGQVSLLGDALTLAGTFAWAGIVLVVRLTPLSQVRAESQLLFQLVVSSVVLVAVAPLFGPTFREIEWLHWAGLTFQIFFVASFGYLAWFWLMSIYRANAVASFSFLSPVLAVLFGWALLGEQVGPQIWGALGLVAAGISLINRK